MKSRGRADHIKEPWRSGGDPDAPCLSASDPGRLAAFSDAVFAITVTLLVLEIRPPTDYSKLLHGLAALWPSYLAYAITFLFIGQVWANHHVMFDHVHAALTPPSWVTRANACSSGC